MRTSLLSIGRRLPDHAADLTAIADGLDRNEPGTIERARTVADRTLRALCEEADISGNDPVAVMLEQLLAKHAIPHTVAAHLRVLYDPDSTLIGDSVRALLAFLEWRVGSRSKFTAVRPGRKMSRKLPLMLGSAIVLVAIAIIVMVTRERERTPVASTAPMIQIAGATFDMGSSDAELAAALVYCREVDVRGSFCLGDNEFLQQEQLRTVTISAFVIDRDEVTVADFVAWLAHQPPDPRRVFPNVRVDPDTKRLLAAPGRERLPIAGVSWNDARQYCEAVDKRLPTEAEWELAARGVGRRLFPWGSEHPQCARVVFARENVRVCSLGSGGDAAPVGSAEGDVTPEGVHDLGGNVAEWTADTGGDRPTCSGPCVNPVATGHTMRVVRGGHWGSFGGQLRGASRSQLEPARTRTNLGFRCARSAR
ncbi:MAG: formylglycine-generating enzyme family protein [Deltaproteobacteria bacterium]|nr:formylglycine-generating enzyme family protein [Deltaproteobacteria bacterium]